MTALPRSVVARTAICLALVAGSVDATALAATGRFASHMTGTVTHVTTNLVSGRTGVAGLGLSVLASFLCGAIVCGAILAALPQQAVDTVLPALVGLEAVLILAGGLALASDPQADAPAVIGIGLLAFAMGLQNTVSVRLLAGYPRTTHLTSAITDLGSEIGVRLGRAIGRATPAPAAASHADTLQNATRVIAAFVAGGVFATAGFEKLGRAGSPCAAVLPGITAWLLWSVRPRPPALHLDRDLA